MSAHRIVVAGGGTAGHVNPLLATSDALKAAGCDVLALGTEQGLEFNLVPEAGYRLVTIPRVPLPRRPSFALATLPRRFHDAVARCKQVLAHADAVVGFGGYVATPAYVAAHQLKLPIIIHEQNARPGLANKVGARWASLVAVTFESTPLKATRGETKVVGLPLRPSIADLAQIRRSVGGSRAARREAAARLGVDASMTTLLVTGGSLGAQHLNDVMVQCAPDLPDGVQVLHLTGKDKDGPVRQAIEGSPVADRWRIRPYLSAMEDAFAVADLVLCRSGAGTVAEIEALGLPAIYVPLAVGNGEQKLNTADHVAAGGAKLISDRHFDADAVRDLVFPLLISEQLEQMREATSDLGRLDAAQNLADAVIRVCEKSKRRGLQ